MPADLTALAVLVLLFVVAGVTRVNLGVLAYVAAAAVGVGLARLTLGEVLAGFPAQLFLTLVGVTYLFAIVRANGTVDWLARRAARVDGGRAGVLLWMFFAVAAITTAAGAVPPAVVALLVPTALATARVRGVGADHMGLMVVYGVCAGAFSPIAVFGAITRTAVEAAGVAVDPLALFAGTFAFAAAMGAAVAVTSGIRRARSRSVSGAESEPSADESADGARAGSAIAWTLAVLAIVVVAVLALGIDVGIACLAAAMLLSVVGRRSPVGGIADIAWPTILTITGVLTYVGVLESAGTIDTVSAAIARIDAPLLVALLVCFVAAAASAFASTTAILGVLATLAVPVLGLGALPATGLLIALALSASVVDASPFSTSGALVVAGGEPGERSALFRRMLAWGLGAVVVVPPVAWAVFVLPGWAG